MLAYATWFCLTDTLVAVVHIIHDSHTANEAPAVMVMVGARSHPPPGPRFPFDLPACPAASLAGSGGGAFVVRQRATIGARRLSTRVHAVHAPRRQPLPHSRRQPSLNDDRRSQTQGPLPHRGAAARAPTPDACVEPPEDASDVLSGDQRFADAGPRLAVHTGGSRESAPHRRPRALARSTSSKFSWTADVRSPSVVRTVDTGCRKHRVRTPELRPCRGISPDGAGARVRRTLSRTPHALRAAGALPSRGRERDDLRPRPVVQAPRRLRVRRDVRRDVRGPSRDRGTARREAMCVDRRAPLRPFQPCAGLGVCATLRAIVARSSRLATDRCPHEQFASQIASD